MNIVRAFVITAAASCLAVGSSTAAEATPSSSTPANFAGNWVVRGEFGALKYTLTCFLKTTEQAISGPCVTIREPLLRTVGKMDDKAMQFKYTTTYDGRDIVLDYRGRIQPDGMAKGSISTGGPSKGVFQATPLSAIAIDPMTPWTISVAFPEGFRYNVLCAFTPDDGKLKGPCAVTQGATLQAAGRLEGSNVSFQYDTDYQGRPIHVEYSGSIQPDGSLKGTIKEGTSAGTFTAERQ